MQSFNKIQILSKKSGRAVHATVHVELDLAVELDLGQPTCSQKKGCPQNIINLISIFFGYMFCVIFPELLLVQIQLFTL